MPARFARLQGRRSRGRVTHTKRHDEEVRYVLSFARSFASQKLSLELAGIYFVAAVEHERKGTKAFDRLQRRLRSFRNIFTELALVGDDAKDTLKVRGLSENELTACLADIRRLEIVYEPVVREYALAIMAVVACAETFINDVAQIVIAGRSAQEHFDKLAVQAKWLFLPALIGKRRMFRLDGGPLQKFAQAVRLRNSLIHFKGLGAPLGSSSVPPFVAELGLSPKNVGDAIDAVRCLIRDFSLRWKGGSGPDWLYPEDESFRRPGFFLGNREAGMVLWADELDRGRFDDSGEE